jgi:hypothetical protein
VIAKILNHEGCIHYGDTGEERVEDPDESEDD